MPLFARNTGPDPGAVLAWQIFAPIAALFVILLLLAGFAGSEFFRPLAIERDLARAQRYADFAAVTVTRAAPSVTTETVIEEFRLAGFETLNFVDPLKVPSWVSPRFVPSGPFVEAWAPVNSAGGASIGALTLRRQADSVVFVQRALRAFAIASCATFALIVLLAWFLLKNRITDRASAMIRELGSTADGGEAGADIIDRVRAVWIASRAKADSENHSLRQLLDGHTEMFCASSKDGTIIEVNAAYCRFFGKKREELVGTNYLDLIPPADRGDVLGSARKLSPQSPENTTEHRVVLPGGGIRWVRWHDSALFDQGAQTTEIISFGTDITAEKNLTGRIDALRLAFDQMQSLAETGSLTWDFAAEHMEWTPQTRRILGVGAAAPASIETLLAVVATDERETVRRLFRGRPVSRGRNFQQEFRAVLPDGSLRVLQSRAEVLADPNTKLLNRLTCTLRDITSLRGAEESTRQELRFREAVERSLAAGLVVRDMAGLTLSANPAFCAMTGFSEEELRAAQLPEEPYWPPEERDNILAALQNALAGNAPSGGFELVFCRKDGSRFDVLVNVSPVFSGDGQPLALLGAVSDISAIQETRRALEASNERLRIAQDVLGFGIWDWDPATDTLFWDRNSFAVFGHHDATDPHEVWKVVHSEEERERLTYKIDRLIAAGAKSGQDRLRIRWPDGSIHEILSTYVILRDTQGKALRVLGVNRDVTAEIEEERELLSARERLNAALEGGRFGTFEHIIDLGDVNWSRANYEINGIDASITDPAELFAAWKANTGDFFPELVAKMDALPVSESHCSYEFTARPPGKEPRRVRVSIFIERNASGHPTRLVGVTRRLD